MLAAVILQTFGKVTVHQIQTIQCQLPNTSLNYKNIEAVTLANGEQKWFVFFGKIQAWGAWEEGGEQSPSRSD